MVDHNDPPQDPWVVWSGNYATKPSNPAANDGVEGCFVLSRKLFLEDFILKHFRQLNQASEIIHQLPYSKKNPDNYNNQSSYMPYDVGYDPNHRWRGDPFYSFKSNNPDNDPAKETKYVWTRDNVQPDPNGSWDGITMSDAGKSHLKQSAKGKAI
jgi:hypothetical protein